MYSKMQKYASFFDSDCQLLVRMYTLDGPRYEKPGPEVIKLFSCSTQLSTKFILFINVKMLTTCISMINKTSERHKARKFFICRYFSFYTLSS